MNFFKKLFQRKPRIVKTDITRRFELVGRVGQGSMSKVWRARDSKSGKMVALKVLDKAKTMRHDARFLPELKKPSEGEVAMSLKHRNIVTTYEHGHTTDGEQFLVMEFVEGVGLSFLIDVQNDLMKKRRLDFIIQLGDAINYFHQQNWIHRDICPRNILIDPDNEVKLIDFGLAVPNTPAFQAPGNRTGTVAYMAPELIKRLKTDQRIDVFSYAVTCFEMYARRHPWDVGEVGETLDTVLQHINSPPTDIRKLTPDIDEQVAAAIMKGLIATPKERWASVGEMLEDFKTARARLSGTAAAKPADGKRRKT